METDIRSFLHAPWNENTSSCVSTTLSGLAPYVSTTAQAPFHLLPTQIELNQQQQLGLHCWFNILKTNKHQLLLQYFENTMSPLTASCSCSTCHFPIPSHITAPDAYAICHCNSCQRRTGGAFHIGAMFQGGDASWLDACPRQDLISYNSWSADTGRLIERAFCKGCGGTLAMWLADHRPEKRGAATALGGQEMSAEDWNGGVVWLTVPAPSLTNFDWRKAVREEKEKVIQCWLKCAVFPEVADGYPVRLDTQPGESAE